MPAPDLIAQRAEKDALAAELNAKPLTTTRFADMKRKIDGDIANAIFQSAKSQATENDNAAPQTFCDAVTHQLQKGLNYTFNKSLPDIKVDNKLLCEVLTEKLSNQQKTAAIDAIALALNQTVNSLSIKTFPNDAPFEIPKLPQLQWYPLGKVEYIDFLIA